MRGWARRYDVSVMTLSRKIAMSQVALVLLAAMLGGSAVWGLLGLNRNLGEALGEYDLLRSVYESGTPIVAARATLLTPVPDAEEAVVHLRQAQKKFEALELKDPAMAVMIAESLRKLAVLIEQLESTMPLEIESDRTEAVAALNQLLNTNAQLAGRTTTEIDRVQGEARRRLWVTTLTSAVLAVVTLGAAVLIGVGQYRGVMRPLRRLDAAARRLAKGHFDQRLATAGHDELSELARQFNRMADELETLYREMERRVEDASRELVRSERLASVGYLAAGVAHEINNPLGIIAGHAELTLRKCEADDPMASGLRAICDEAFRCKKITEKLLSLSRGGSGQREPTDMAVVVNEVKALVADLPRYRDRQFEVTVGEGRLVVLVDAAQMKQVVLNLVTNAFEATAVGGRVAVRVDRGDNRVRVSVSDDGAGMDGETLDHVFEPFYTRRRGAERGTGLGLSITHAIVADHGGRITAHSDGPNRGSRFVFELPQHAG